MGGTKRVVIGGTGAVTPYGNGWPAARDGLAGRRRMLGRAGAAAPGLEAYTLGLVPDLAAFRAEFPQLSPPLPLRETQMVLLAAREAMRDASMSVGPAHEELGVFLDRTWGPAHMVPRLVEPYLAGGPQAISPVVFAQSVANAPSGAVARLLGARGPNLTTMGGGALMLALRALRRGDATAVLAGGFESVQKDYLLAHESLGSLRPRELPEAYAPHDEASVGSTLGEGAVVMALVACKDGDPDPRGRAELAGAACAFAHTPWDPELLAACIRDALDDAGVAPGEITASFGAGDGVKEHDRAEVEALARSGVRARPESLKGLVGESLGMAAALSVAWAASAVRGPTLVVDASFEGGILAAVVRGGPP